MSENNKPELITTDAEVLAPEPYDFEFITSTLNLIPICSGQAAINAGAIIDIEKDEFENATISLHGGESYDLTSVEMAEFERTLKHQIEKTKAKAKEVMRDQIKMQMEIGAELQGSVQPGMIVGAPTGKRWRPQ